MDTIVKTDSVKSIFEDVAVKSKFQEMLGKKSTGFLVSVINAVTSSDNLKNADRNSILFAAATAASLDLPINPNLGFAYIIPYSAKDDTGTYKQFAQFQIGVRGLIQLAQRSGQFLTISATAIYEGQLVEMNPLTGFRFDFTKKTSDKVVGYASYFKLLNGFEKTLYMTVAELQAHGTKYSKTFAKGFGLWKDNFDAMALKTVLKLLLSKFAPLSIEMQKAVNVDQSVVKSWDAEDVDYVDNEKVNVDIIAEKIDKEIQDRKENAIAAVSVAKTIKQLQEVEKDDVAMRDNEVKAAYAAKLKFLSDK